MRLLLHIGTEKTGSTAVQESLYSARAHLLAHGYALPTFLEESNHRAVACAFIQDGDSDDFLRARGLVDATRRAEFRADLLAALQADLRQFEDRAHSYVISSEHFHSRLRSLAELHQFARAVKPFFKEVRVLCYLRRQDRLALSFYSQKLRDGYIPPAILPLQNLERWAPMLPPFYDFDALLQRWEQAWPDAVLEPRIYGRSELIQGDVVADFFDWLACPLPAEVGRARHNASLSCPAQSALLAFNRVHGGDASGRANSKALRDRLNAFLEQRDRGVSRLPSQIEAHDWLQAFDGANRRVARRWFGREELFDESLDDYPEHTTPPDWERAAALLAEFLDIVDGPVPVHPAVDQAGPETPAGDGIGPAKPGGE